MAPDITSHFDLRRFEAAQGRLGHSAMAQRFAICYREEAIAYLAMPLLGARLIECTTAVLSVADRTAHQIFG